MDNNITVCRAPARHPEGNLNYQPRSKREVPFDPDLDYNAPLELLILRLVPLAQTPEHREDLRLAWRQCLQHGPTVRRSAAPPAPAVPFNAETASVPPRRVEQLERCLEPVL